jgi:mobilization protein NikA
MDSRCGLDGTHMKPATRTRSVGTKVTEEEYSQLEALACADGLSISEWSRSVLLERNKGDQPSESEKALLSELLALRTILLNLHFIVARGGTVSADEMQAIIDRADRDKTRKALERLGAETNDPGREP